MATSQVQREIALAAPVFERSHHSDYLVRQRARRAGAGHVASDAADRLAELLYRGPKKSITRPRGTWPKSFG